MVWIWGLMAVTFAVELSCWPSYLSAVIIGCAAQVGTEFSIFQHWPHRCSTKCNQHRVRDEENLELLTPSASLPWAHSACFPGG